MGSYEVASQLTKQYNLPINAKVQLSFTYIDTCASITDGFQGLSLDIQTDVWISQSWRSSRQRGHLPRKRRVSQRGERKITGARWIQFQLEGFLCVHRPIGDEQIF